MNRPNYLLLWAMVAAVSHLNSDAAHAIEIEAYAGQPFGVGQVTLPVVSSGPAAPLQDERFTVSSPDGRVLYPVIKEEPARRLLRRLLDIQTPRNVTIYFMFRGDEPF